MTEGWKKRIKEGDIMVTEVQKGGSKESTNDTGGGASEAERKRRSSVWGGEGGVGSRGVR